MHDAPSADEINAAKQEVVAAITRRIKDDRRAKHVEFSLIVMVCGEIIADAVKAAAKDADHEQRLLAIADLAIRQRLKM